MRLPAPALPAPALLTPDTVVLPTAATGRAVRGRGHVLLAVEITGAESTVTDRFTRPPVLYA
ncbi:hypothetical protein [Streptomyces sp. NPDC093544]|uniref:hypothetical protein n=1 Tax=Streptomyces sp. NPDC093544 TaxID=3155200 RepID=UPI0034315516